MVEQISNESIIERVARQLDPNQEVSRSGHVPRAVRRRSSLTQATPDRTVSPSSVPAGDIVEINVDRLERSGLVTPQGGRKRLVDEFRIIKRSILRTAFEREDSVERFRNLVMVTSANSGEGKTSTSISLAMSVASERDRPVLLIDLDPVRQDLSRTLGAARRPGDRKGLFDLIGDENVELGDVLLPTSVPQLDLLPTGKDSPLSNELLSGSKMKELMEDLSHWYRDGLVIIDTPPVLASTEPNVLAMYVGQTVVVVEANRTERSAIDEALGLIEQCDCISFVLNKSSSAETPYQYGRYQTR